MTNFPDPGHNHVACLSRSLDRARTAFEARGQKLTDLREKVFREIAASHHAVGAYDIIDRLSREGTRLAPVSVYRAIDALISAGVVHRLESRNAYFACHSAHAAGQRTVVLSCGRCGTIAEVDGRAVLDALDRVVADNGFEQESAIIEVAGRCAHCPKGSP